MWRSNHFDHQISGKEYFLELQKKNCADVIQTKPVIKIDTSRIDVGKLIGVWESVDSAKQLIKFINVSPLEIRLPADSFSAYTFYKDSLNTVSASGVIFMWPPSLLRSEIY